MLLYCKCTLQKSFLLNLTNIGFHYPVRNTGECFETECNLSVAELCNKKLYIWHFIADVPNFDNSVPNRLFSVSFIDKILIHRLEFISI